MRSFTGHPYVYLTFHPDGTVEAEGISSGKMILHEQWGGMVVLYIAGRSVFSGTGQSRRYYPSHFVVLRESETNPGQYSEIITFEARKRKSEET